MPKFPHKSIGDKIKKLLKEGSDRIVTQNIGNTPVYKINDDTSDYWVILNKSDYLAIGMFLHNENNHMGLKSLVKLFKTLKLQFPNVEKTIFQSYKNCLVCLEKNKFKLKAEKFSYYRVYDNDKPQEINGSLEKHEDKNQIISKSFIVKEKYSIYISSKKESNGIVYFDILYFRLKIEGSPEYLKYLVITSITYFLKKLYQLDIYPKINLYSGELYGDMDGYLMLLSSFYGENKDRIEKKRFKGLREEFNDYIQKNRKNRAVLINKSDVSIIENNS